MQTYQNCINKSFDKKAKIYEFDIGDLMLKKTNKLHKWNANFVISLPQTS